MSKPSRPTRPAGLLAVVILVTAAPAAPAQRFFRAPVVDPPSQEVTAEFLVGDRNVEIPHRMISVAVELVDFAQDNLSHCA